MTVHFCADWTVFNTGRGPFFDEEYDLRHTSHMRKKDI
jgi:hypothetical protein